MHLEMGGKVTDEFKDYCHKHHLKITPQRTAVFEALDALKTCHPSTDMMYRKVRELVPNISYDTVNRILLKFAEIGLIDVVEGHGGPRRFDPGKDPHHHFHCIRCARIFDFPGRDCDNIQIPGRFTKFFRILSQRVVLTGICKDCLKKGRQRSETA
jgi:Fur family transcriptional regulator, peroxide stress response regulator